MKPGLLKNENIRNGDNIDYDVKYLERALRHTR